MRPTQEICITNLDCGFDVGGTDIMDVKSSGYPFISRKTEVTRKYEQHSLDVVANTSSKYYVNTIVLNTLFWCGVTTGLFMLKRIWKKNANNRH